MKYYYVYMLASKRRGTLYIGITNDLIRRMHEHKDGMNKGFTQKYKVFKLVYFQQCENVESVIQREKQLKAWHREWKIRLIEETNPLWNDLSDTLF
jgi:putative endonuclease